MSAETTPPEAEKAKYAKGDSVYMRLARAQEEVRTITQDVTVSMGAGSSYKGVSASQIVALAKRVLIDNGIIFIPKPDAGSFRIEGNLRLLWVDGHLVNLDNPSDQIVSGSWGEGADRGDKGVSKAYTNANKNILAKVLEMTTIDDTDGDHDGVNKDGTETGSTKGNKGTSKTPPPMTADESSGLKGILLKSLPAAPMSAEAGEKFATEHGAELARLLPHHADEVRREFAARRKKK